MTTDEANSLLTDDSIRLCAVILAAIDRLQEVEYATLEPELRKMGKFSDSTVISSVDRVLQGYTFMTIPGNGNGIKVTLSIFLRGLQLLERHEQVDLALKACEQFETLKTE